ncbi:MAG: SprT-like domain-containing protein [Gemmatimonadota bacterium]|nr:SprT-like domain-containing protein [Gemmatimonadota bacterium]
MRSAAGHEADAVLLRGRLVRAGLALATPVAVHQNRRVLVHVRDGRLRVHRGFAYAPDRVVRAVVLFAQARTTAAARGARRELASFPVHDYVPAPAPRVTRAAPRPGDGAILEHLRVTHAALNTQHFEGMLSAPVFRVSHRMRRKLGQVVVPATGPVAIVISRRHVDRDGWDEVTQTLLHEMVHQWQKERGFPLGHGPAFREKARAVGVEPLARRAIPAGGCRGQLRRTDAV